MQGVCLFFCLCLNNVKTAEPIRPKFSVGPRVRREPREGLWIIEFKKFAS